MISVNCYSNNVNLAQKLSLELQGDNFSLNHFPLNFKIDRFKQISILLISNKTELDEWIEYCQKIGSAKKNLTFKFVLPLLFASVKEGVELEYNAIPVGQDLNKDEISLINFLLKQKEDLFLQRLNKSLAHTQKFLVSVSPKLKWKNQVVLSSEEVSSFITMQNMKNDILSLGEGLPLVKFWDVNQTEQDEQYIYLYLDSEVHRMDKSTLTEELIRKLVLFSIFQANYNIQKDQQAYTDFVIHFYDTVFNLAPFPIAIELSERDLVWQNKTFSNLKLLPRNVKNMHDNEKIHTKHGFFIVYKYQFSVLDLEYKLVYLAQQSEKFSNASEDLGIMTSSLAHEMNNPLSAIKAAIEVIGIIDRNFKSQDTLDQMLVSVNRCLQLVKIFLGFTKASYQLDSSKIGAADRIPFRDCWDYAVQLMRTRLVSASLRLHFDWKVQKPFIVGNSNILTMMLYWLLSQFVNNIERKFLVSRSISHDQRVVISEDDLVVKINFDVSVREIQTAIEQSLLMNHLLDLEDLIFSINNESEILIRKDSRPKGDA